MKFGGLDSITAQAQKLNRPSKKQNKTKVSRPCRLQIGSIWGRLSFFICQLATLNKNQQALLLLYTQFSSTESKENSEYKRDGFFLRFNPISG